MNEKDTEKQDEKLEEVLDDIIHLLIKSINTSKTLEANEKYPQPQFPEDYTDIEREIAEMLTESTGIDILDSGMEDNRFWQRNRRIKDFRKLPKLNIVLFDDGELIFSLNIFHYLTSMLEINEETKELNTDFNNFINLSECHPWLVCMEEYADQLMEKQWHVEPPFNTSNNENILSQVLQGIIFYQDGHEEDPFIILQIHNGSDVRGGYTRPRIFKIKDLDMFIMTQYNVYANCECGTVYSDDCGYHWYNIHGKLNVIDYKLPMEWKIYKENNTNILKCDKCNSKVNFYSELE